MLTLPFKLNQDRRHHIPKPKHKVANWAEYDAALRQRGSLTVWFTEAAVAAWEAEPRTTPPGAIPNGAPFSQGQGCESGQNRTGELVSGRPAVQDSVCYPYPDAQRAP